MKFKFKIQQNQIEAAECVSRAFDSEHCINNFKQF